MSLETVGDCLLREGQVRKMVFSQRHEKGIGAEAENLSLELNFPRDRKHVALRLPESSWRGWTTMSLFKVNHKCLYLKEMNLEC